MENFLASNKSLALLLTVFVCMGALFGSSIAQASDFNHPWRNKQKAIVIDAYEKNPIDWTRMIKDKRVRGFIGKSSDGMPSPWSCNGNSTERQLCKKSFQNYWMKQQLYHTRKLLAKQLGLKWGAYHLGRPGNPIGQANHFLNFAKPEKDDLIALDIEHDDPKKWISFEDAEVFAKHIHKRIGRYPVLYTNHDTAKRIAARRAEFPILSRLQLWYARFKGDVRGAFPMGNWDSYTLWQFSAHPNCNKRRCLYRVPGTPTNIDVNVSTLTISEFDKAWPFDGLVPEKPFEQDPNILLVEAQKPIIEVNDKPLALASVIPTNIAPEVAQEVSLTEEATFQIAGIDLKTIAIPSARIRLEPVTIAKTPDAVDKQIKVASISPNLTKSTSSKSLEQKSLSTVSRPLKLRTAQQDKKDDYVTAKRVAKAPTSTQEKAKTSTEVTAIISHVSNEAGEVVAGENFGLSGKVNPTLIRKVFSQSTTLENSDKNEKTIYNRGLTLLLDGSNNSL